MIVAIFNPKAVVKPEEWFAWRPVIMEDWDNDTRQIVWLSDCTG